MVVGQFSQDVDILVIGGGPSGYTSAFRSAELGKTVAIVDPSPTLGGECLHNACIPSKCSLHGVSSEEVVTRLGKGVEQKCKSLGIERLCGLAHFENKKMAQITGDNVSIVKFRKAIIATGSKPREHVDFQNALQVEEAYKHVPQNKNILIIGNTPSAVESATFLARSNTVSLWCDGDFLPMFDAVLTKPFARIFFKDVTLCDEKPREEMFDLCFLAGHRPPQTESLQLEHAQVTCTDGFIDTNTACQTSNPKIYAVGECADCHHSAGLAIAQGRVAGESAAGLSSFIDSSYIPQVVWSSPELAQCGTFSKQHSVQVKWGNSGLALALGQQQGMTVLSFDPDSQAILGIGIMGAHATEMISEGVLALEMGATLYDLAVTVRPHPTCCEMLNEASRVALSSL